MRCHITHKRSLQFSSPFNDCKCNHCKCSNRANTCCARVLIGLDGLGCSVSNAALNAWNKKHLQLKWDITFGASTSEVCMLQGGKTAWHSVNVAEIWDGCVASAGSKLNLLSVVGTSRSRACPGNSAQMTLLRGLNFIMHIKLPDSINLKYDQSVWSVIALVVLRKQSIANYWSYLLFLPGCQAGRIIFCSLSTRCTSVAVDCFMSSQSRKIFIASKPNVCYDSAIDAEVSVFNPGQQKGWIVYRKAWCILSRFESVL